uniref:Putative homing endonuclease n=1 Tax=viral metagenome TaxID=1070528 RepID=A0A6H1ZB63_9ZZZZ
MLDERFWSKVNKDTPSGCWEWTANKNNKGYGRFTVDSYAGKQLAHRLAYKDAFGPIPKDGLILHSCDNPACVNPAHLRIGTHKANVADMDERGRRNPPHLKGETNPSSKLTDIQVIEIRRAYIAGEKRESIGPRYGLSPLSVSDITSGRAWKHLLGVDGAPSLADLKAARRITSVAEADAREVWRLHFERKSVPEIVEQTGLGFHAVAGIVGGKTWRHLPDAPTVEELHAGGVGRGHNQFSRGGDTRSAHPKTKIPTSEIPAILARLAAGETLEAVGKTYGVKKTAIWHIKKAASPSC